MVCVRTRAGSRSRARTAPFTTPTRCRRLTRSSRRTSASCSSEHRKPNPTSPALCGRTNTRTESDGVIDNGARLGRTRHNGARVNSAHYRAWVTEGWLRRPAQLGGHAGQDLTTALPRSQTHSIRLPDLLGCRPDQIDHLGRMRNHRHVVRIDLDHGGAHPLGEKPLRVRWNGLVTLGDEVPRRKGLPRDLAHHFPERADGQGLLRRKHYLGLDGIDVAGKVTDEVVLG